MSAQNYSSTQKVAILMLAMGDEVAAELMRHLPHRDVQRISRALASMQRVDQETVDGVIAEFSEKLRVDSLPGVAGGATSTMRILAKAFRDDNDLVKTLGLQGPASLTALEDMDAVMLGNFLQKEQPQTIALVMAHLPPQKFKDTIKRLPSALHSEILIRVAKLETVDAQTLEDLNQALEEEWRRHGGSGQGYRVGGPEKVAKLLNALADDMGRSLLDDLEGRDPKLSEQIREHLFTYEDLKRVSDEGIRTLLQQVERKDLLLALKLTSQKLTEKLFSNMSQRARDMLVDDLANQPKAPRSEVEQAQKKMAALALVLRDAGKITLASDDEFV